MLRACEEKRGQRIELMERMKNCPSDRTLRAYVLLGPLFSPLAVHTVRGLHPLADRSNFGTVEEGI